MEGCWDRNFLNPSLNSTDSFLLPRSGKHVDLHKDKKILRLAPFALHMLVTSIQLPPASTTVSRHLPYQESSSTRFSARHGHEESFYLLAYDALETHPPPAGSAMQTWVETTAAQCVLAHKGHGRSWIGQAIDLWRLDLRCKHASGRRNSTHSQQCAAGSKAFWRGAIMTLPSES